MSLDQKFIGDALDIDLPRRFICTRRISGSIDVGMTDQYGVVGID